MGLRPLSGYDSGYESRRGYGCLSVGNAVCCQLEVSSTVQGRPTECFCCLSSEVSGTVQGSPTECFCCLLSVRGLWDGPGETY